MNAVARQSGQVLSDLLDGFGRVAPPHDRRIRGLCTDSRSACGGDLFLAYPGVNRHGGDHIREAIRAGAVAIALDADYDRPTSSAGLIPIVWVPRLRSCVGEIAARFYTHPSRHLLAIGVTGTNGKTSVAHTIARVLDRAGNTGPCGIMGTLGWGGVDDLTPATHTTPDAVTIQRQLADLRALQARSVVLEVSSHGLDQGRVAGVEFAVAVFTNLSRDHLDYHGDMGAYGEAKKLLFQWPGLRAAVLNLDDAFCQAISADLAADVRVFGYTLNGSRSPENECIVGSALRLHDRGLSLRIRVGRQTAEIESPLLGRLNAYNLLASLGALLAVGVTLEEAARELASVGPVPGRMERIPAGPGSPLVIVDYAHTPDGLDQALIALRRIRAGKLFCIFGCGGERDAGKRPLMGRIAEALADCVILTTDNARHEDPAAIVKDIRSGMNDPDRARSEPDRARAIASAIEQATENDTVLIAGKGHEDYQDNGGVRRPYSDRQMVMQILRGAKL
ncbi:MAG: UDP-N-acetylmuramoyl-L-alanyl-D-glutamate--2,6-diaminopimelate ligase [Gammaproteobacteria bacterium]